MRYYKFPKWLKPIFPGAIWDFSFLPKPKSKEDGSEQSVIYLTFDDGPHPETTPWLIELLKTYNAKATHFCLGKNVERYPDLYAQLIKEGHQVGNHTQDHLKGLKSSTKTYVENVELASQVVSSRLFRPPYGKMKPKQFYKLKKKSYQTVFWSHITYDFDCELSAEKRKSKTLKSVKHGSIVVFHDSIKAFPQLQKELPELLSFWLTQGYVFKVIPVN